MQSYLLAVVEFAVSRVLEWAVLWVRTCRPRPLSRTNTIKDNPAWHFLPNCRPAIERKHSPYRNESSAYEFTAFQCTISVTISLWLCTLYFTFAIKHCNHLKKRYVCLPDLVYFQGFLRIFWDSDEAQWRAPILLSISPTHFRKLEIEEGKRSCRNCHSSWENGRGFWISVLVVEIPKDLYCGYS